MTLRSFTTLRFLCAAAVAAGALGGLPLGSAAAASGGGAAVVPSAKGQASSMVIRKISCLEGCSSVAAVKAGATLRFQGPRLTRGKRVVYLGGAGTADDVLDKLTITKAPSGGRLVTAKVPMRALAGPVAIEVADGVRSAASAIKIAFPEGAQPITLIDPLPGNGPFFPIVGKYTFGTGTAEFGGAGQRVHEGQDVFAECGTPLVAAEGGEVTVRKFHANAGNFVVIDVEGADRDEAYMHLRTPAIVKVGQRVAAGQQIGEVGDTGRASGCHLHFELWLGEWQGVGGTGRVIDPLPTLRAWAEQPGTKARR